MRHPTCVVLPQFTAYVMLQARAYDNWVNNFILICSDILKRAELSWHNFLNRFFFCIFFVLIIPFAITVLINDLLFWLEQPIVNKRT